MSDWFSITWEQTVGIILTVFLINLALLLLVRINGLRTFSKMSSHDFAVTIAIGSILATTILQASPSFGVAFVAIAALLFWQNIFSRWRLKRNNKYIENSPVLLARDGKIIYENLKKTRVSEGDLYAKMREANVLRLQDVQAAILEVTGDVSILHGNNKVDDILLDGIEK